MQQYFGIIELGTISNDPPGGELVKARFVHYPDCQQLILWLPQYGGRGYGQIRLIEADTDTVVDDRPVTDRLSGSIQLLWDTLDIPPGDYRIEIDHPHGGKHVILLKKYEQGIEPPKQVVPEMPEDKTQESEQPIVYRDGFGNVLPNEDLILREKVLKEMSDRFARKITYEGTFRAGTIIYQEGNLRIEFYHEMGGGNCMFYVDIPTEASWEARTGVPPSRRQEIVEYVAETVHRQQAPSTRYEIQEAAIVYYHQ